MRPGSPDGDGGQLPLIRDTSAGRPDLT
jgi:hypothetical protein